MKKGKNYIKVICPYCGANAVLRQDKYVHGERAKGEWLYVCANYPECDAYVSTHKETKLPRGSLAKGDLRNKRIRAHKMFDRIWKENIMSKKEAYRWMEYFMGLPKNEGHIGFFSDYRCDLLMKKAGELLINNHIEMPSNI